MTRVLITGGSGFIGTHIVSALLKDGRISILNIDISEPKIKAHEVVWKKVDICNKSLLANVVKEFQPNKIIHLAARTDLRGKELQDYAVNIDGVRNLLDALDEIPSLQQAIFASSMYVCYPGYTPRDFDDYAPHTLYGESKVMTESIIKEKNPSSYTWSIIRPTSIWGPYFSEPYDKFFKIILSHSYFHLGKRACKKTYGYIDNTVYQILSIFHASPQKIAREVYYLGDYSPYNITEWADEIGAIAKIKIPQIPYFLFQLAAWFGDTLKAIGVTFPMTSFRLKNMTTDNVHNLEPIQQIAPILPASRIEGSKATIQWITDNK